MILSDDELRKRQYELERLLRNYMLREPYRPIVEDALRKEAAERRLIPPEYRLVVCFDAHIGRWKSRVYLVLRSAVELLGDLTT